MKWLNKRSLKKIEELEAEVEFWQKAAEDAIQASRATTDERMKTIDWNVELIEQRRELVGYLESLLSSRLLTKYSLHYSLAEELIQKYGESKKF
jgi:hypothetical protein